MQWLKRFVRLSQAERSLVLQAALLIPVVRVSLAWLSLRTVQVLAMHVTWGDGEALSPRRIAWAVRSAGYFVPRSTCLVQALAAQALLIRHGYRPRLTIGVAKSGFDQFGAHAWVTCEDEVLIGGADIGNYTALLDLEADCFAGWRRSEFL
jgi:hypothetical protein